ncbi:MAG: hypothetical protein D3923_04470 [Candidatus Electrothrix sp. AR3]|nr:hypothetical protein [Candidatus Electrothrix sp. AR3]
MYKDEIIAEVWKNRDAYTAKHHHNLSEIVVDLQDRQKRSGCRVVDRRDRRRPSGQPSSCVTAEA